MQAALIVTNIESASLVEVTDVNPAEEDPLFTERNGVLLIELGRDTTCGVVAFSTPPTGIKIGKLVVLT